MKKTTTRLALWAALAFALASAAGLAWSQTVASAAPTVRSPPVASAARATVAPVKMEREEFLRTHRWDPVSDVWTLRSGMSLPAGVMPRADVMAARDTFISTHRWEDGRGWRPLRSGTRNLSALTPEQLRVETRHFMRTHTWDETTEEWLKKPVARSRGK